MSTKILVVDDEAKIVKPVRSYLEQSGFTVVEAADGQTALIQARREKPDLVVLDLGLPGIDGLAVVRTLRRERETPIIMLTARIEDTDKIVGLELGADDYVTKPFNPRELVARVRAVLQRVSGATLAAEILRAGALALDAGGHHATLDGRPLGLIPTEFDLQASRRRICRTCSTASTGATKAPVAVATGRDWGWRSCGRSFWPTADRSRRAASPATERLSQWPCPRQNRWSRRREGCVADLGRATLLSPFVLRQPTLSTPPSTYWRAATAYATMTAVVVLPDVEEASCPVGRSSDTNGR